MLLNVEKLPFCRIDIPKLVKNNGEENTQHIIDIFLEIFTKYPELPWNKQRLTSNKTITGAYYDMRNKTFCFDFGSCELRLNDIRFLVYHEVGHFIDNFLGFLSFDMKEDTFLFEGNCMAGEIVYAMCEEMDLYIRNDWITKRPEVSKQLWRMYGSLPHEYSANVFAANHVEAPDDIGLDVFWQVGAGILEPYDFNAD